MSDGFLKERKSKDDRDICITSLVRTEIIFMCLAQFCVYSFGVLKITSNVKKVDYEKTQTP